VMCDERHIPPAVAMGHIAEQLAKRGIKYTHFDERYRKYRQLRQEIEGDPNAPRGVIDLLARGVTDFAIKSGRGIPGVGVLLETADEKVAGETVAQLVKYGLARWGNKDEVILVRETDSVLTPLFLELLAMAYEQKPVVLIFDVFERCPSPKLPQPKENGGLPVSYLIGEFNPSIARDLPSVPQFVHFPDELAPIRSAWCRSQCPTDVDPSRSHRSKLRTPIELRRPLAICFGPEGPVRPGNHRHVVRFLPVRTVPDVEFGNRLTQQVANDIQVAQHALPELSCCGSLIARAVQRKAPTQQVARFAYIIRKLLVEPPERFESAAIISQEHVTGSEFVPLSGPISVETMFFFFFPKPAFMALQAGLRQSWSSGRSHKLVGIKQLHARSDGAIRPLPEFE
jgi:hypothetical protein